jgi:hypothetical protein
MYTHNQIIQLLKSIAINHEQINSIGFGNIYENESDRLLIYKKPDTNTPVYPLLWADVKSAKVIKLESQTIYTIYMMDIINKDNSNQNEVLSDMQQVMLDIIAYLQDPAFDELFFVDISSTMNPFIDNLGDEVAGWQMDLTFRVPYLADRCAIPLTNNNEFAFLQESFNNSFS